MEHKKIRRYYIEIADSTGIIGAKNEFVVTEFNVIGENAQNMVIDDLHFTTISKTPKDYNTSLDQKSISITVGDNVWGNRVTYSLYTFGEKKANAIKKEIEKAILKKVGFFIGGIDLSIIK